MKRNSLRMVIRRYVFGLLNSHPNEEVQIPSYNVLAKKFNMARSTAQLELKSLVDEGYLITRPGIGTFANVHRERGSAAFIPSVMIVTGSGDYVYKQFSDICFQKNLEEKIATCPARIQEIFFSSGNEEQIYEELTSLNSSLLIWIKPPSDRHDLIRRVAAKMPVFAVYEQVKGVPSFTLDMTQLGYDIGLELVRQKRYRLIYLERSNSNRQLWNGIVHAYQESGIKLDDRYLLEYEEGYANTEELLESGYRPDAVFFREGDGTYIVDALRRYNIDLNDECRLISATYKPRCLSEPMLLAGPPYVSAGIHAGELAIGMLDKEEVPMETIFVPFDYKVELV